MIEITMYSVKEFDLYRTDRFEKAILGPWEDLKSFVEQTSYAK